MILIFIIRLNLVDAFFQIIVNLLLNYYNLKKLNFKVTGKDK